MNINILYEDEEVIVCEKPAGVAAQKTVRTGGHGKPSEKLPGRKGRTAVYRGGTQAGSAGARSDGFCQNKRSCGGFKPPGADKNGR